MTTLNKFLSWFIVPGPRQLKINCWLVFFYEWTSLFILLTQDKEFWLWLRVGFVPGKVYSAAILMIGRDEWVPHCVLKLVRL